MYSWSLPTLVLVFFLLLLYMAGWRSVHASFPTALSPWRAVVFAAGMMTVGVALGSPLAMLDHYYLTAHMIQHLLTTTIAPPLILLGAPFVIMAHARPRVFSAVAGRSPLAHPVVCWLAGVAVVIGWHVPAAFALGMKSPAWHTIEQATFLTAGMLFWWPVIRPWPAVAKWPTWSIPVYLFLATLPCDALSAFLCLCNRVVYPHYGLYDPMALKDQACAGALMWVWVTFAYLFPAAVLTFRLLSPERRFIQEQVA